MVNINITVFINFNHNYLRLTLDFDLYFFIILLAAEPQLMLTAPPGMIGSTPATGVSGMAYGVPGAAVHAQPVNSTYK